MSRAISTITIQKSNLFRGGGLEKYTRRLIQSFLEKNWQVTVLTTGKIPESSSHFISHPNLQIISHLYRFPTSFLRVLEFDHFCKKYVEKHPTKVVFGMDRNSFQTHLRAGNGVHAAYLERRKKNDSFCKKISYFFNPLHRLLLHIEKKAFLDPLLQKIFTNSFMVKNEILSYYPVDEKKIQVIHNGVEWLEYEKAFSNWQEGKKEIAEKLQIDPNHFQFVFIGHNYQRKGLDPLLLALASLPRRDFHLTVIGKEKHLSKYRKLSQTLNLSSHVTFVGEAFSSIPFYQLADCVVIPSYYDPFANVTIEALAMGVFIVSSKTNGGHEILSPRSGIVIDSLDDISSIQLALLAAMDHKKTVDSSLEIRNSVKEKDFSVQLSFFTKACEL